MVAGSGRYQQNDGRSGGLYYDDTSGRGGGGGAVAFPRPQQHFSQEPRPFGGLSSDFMPQQPINLPYRSASFGRSSNKNSNLYNGNVYNGGNDYKGGNSNQRRAANQRALRRGKRLSRRGKTLELNQQSHRRRHHRLRHHAEDPIDSDRSYVWSAPESRPRLHTQAELKKN